MRKLILLMLCASFTMIAGAQSDSTLVEFAAKYKMAEGSAVPEVDIRYEKGKLNIESQMGGGELKRKEGDVFDLVEFGGVVTFIRDENKVVVGIKIDVRGRVLEGKKIPPAGQFSLSYKHIDIQHIKSDSSTA